MPRKRAIGRGANGSGTIRKVTTKRNGREYTYWQGRYTEGFDPGTGKQIQRSITGKTQKEVAQKLRQITLDLEQGTYQTPSKMTVGEWLDIWTDEYLNSVKPRTVEAYKANCKHHIKPAIGAIRLTALTPIDVQRFYNRLKCADSNEPMSAKTKKNIHGTLHRALERAVKLGYLRVNPADKPDLPRIERKEIKPLDDAEIKKFLQIIKGHKYEYIYLVTLFTGLREGEVLGLTWECVDFDAKHITVRQQLQKRRGTNGQYELASTKNGKVRVLTPADYVLDVLRLQRAKKNQERLMLGGEWSNPMGLVFTSPTGGHLCAQTVYLHFKSLVAEAGFPEARFHDLRHSYAVAALKSGDDIKTVQENLGHHTAAFTLDVYGHVTNQMKQESAERMQRFIQSVAVGGQKG